MEQPDIIRFTWYSYDASALINDDWSSFDVRLPDENESYEQARDLVKDLADEGYTIVDVGEEIVSFLGTPTPPEFADRGNYLAGELLEYAAVRN